MMREAGELERCLADPYWRLSNLYWIINKDGKAVPFEPNDEQIDFYKHLHTLNIILKARQLGFSTLMQMIALDQCLFNDNFTAGVIANTLPNALKLMSKASYAYDQLPESIKRAKPIVRRNQSEILWGNGSSISVGTSARGGTLQLLHVSEMGNIARKYPEKAKEIVTGAFEAVPQGGLIVVESTAEGAGGEFYELAEDARKKREQSLELGVMDFKLHFYGWYMNKGYSVDPHDVHISEAQEKYFRKIEAELGIQISAGQRAWYVKKEQILNREMKREYPSTPKEAFEQAVEGAIYGDEMTLMRENGRITELTVDPLEPVNTFWDLGANDYTAIWLHQQIGQWNHFIGYMQGSHTGLKAWWQKLEDLKQELGFERWGKHWLPHDGNAARQGEEVESALSILTRIGVKNVDIISRVSAKSIGIDLTRDALRKSVRICSKHCADGIKTMDAYRYIWDDKRGMWTNEPYHDWASNGADAFRQFAQMPKQASIGDSLAAFKNRKRNWR